jgi:PhnB protein
MRNAPFELTPFIFFYGRCQEALEFYKNALGGSYEIVMREDDKVQYATFAGGGIAFKASDGMSARTIDPDEGNVTLALHAPDATRAAEIFTALSDGGTVITAFDDAQWGGKFGALHDRFGNEWFVTAP